MRFVQALTAPSNTRTTVIAALVAIAGAYAFSLPALALTAVLAVLGYEWSKSAQLVGLRGSDVYLGALAVLVVVGLVGAPFASVLGLGVLALAKAMGIAVAASFVTATVGSICKR